MSALPSASRVIAAPDDTISNFSSAALTSAATCGDRPARASAATPTCTAIRKRIRQILDNLLSNARHATPDGGQITVHVTTQDTSIQVQVTDTGPGIPRPDRERIFDRFTRLDRRTDSNGLGLAIARGIATAHSGTLTCIDRAGQGASFRLQLPRQTR